MIIKAPSLARSFDYIYSRDDAFKRHELADDPTPEQKAEHDEAESAFAEAYRVYRETGELHHLEPHFREGERPALWRIKHLRGKALAVIEHVAGKANESDDDNNITSLTLFVACQLGLKGVDGCEGEAGKPLEIRHVRDKDVGVKKVANEVMEGLMSVDSGGLVFQLGSAALMGMQIPGK